MAQMLPRYCNKEKNIQYGAKMLSLMASSSFYEFDYLLLFFFFSRF